MRFRMLNCLAGAVAFAAGLQTVRAGIRAHLADQKAAAPEVPSVLPGEVTAPTISGEAQHA